MRSEGAFTIVELRPSVSAAARRNQMELQADENMVDMLKMLRLDTGLGSASKSISQIDKAVNSLGGLHAEDSPPAGTVSGRSKMNHTTAALMAHAFSLLAVSKETEAEAVQALAKASEQQIEMQAIADNVSVRAQRCAEEAKRFMDEERTARLDSRGVDGLREESAEDRAKRKERTKKRFKLLKQATSVIGLGAGQVMQEQAAERLKAAKKASQENSMTGFP